MSIQTQAVTHRATREGRDASAADGSTFAPGLRLLDKPLRGDVERLYGVLRCIDDLVDEHDPRAAARVDAVERWTRGQQTNTAETRVLARLAACHRLPPDAVLEFCAGMQHDLARASIATEEDFERYCQQAGGSVGIMLANMLGAAHLDHSSADPSASLRELESRMATLGRAMQVTNILRDIDEDLGHGRIYIPRSTIERFGFPAPGARRALLEEQIARADALYEQGAGAISLLRQGGAAMALSAALYREILREIERDGFGVNPGRVTVPAWRTQALIAKHSGADVEGDEGG